MKYRLIVRIETDKKIDRDDLAGWLYGELGVACNDAEPIIGAEIIDYEVE